MFSNNNKLFHDVLQTVLKLNKTSNRLSLVSYRRYIFGMFPKNRDKDFSDYLKVARMLKKQIILDIRKRV